MKTLTVLLAIAVIAVLPCLAESGTKSEKAISVVLGAPTETVECEDGTRFIAWDRGAMQVWGWFPQDKEEPAYFTETLRGYKPENGHEVVTASWKEREY